MMSKPKILIVNEDLAAIETEFRYLSMNGYEVDCWAVRNVTTEKLVARQPDFLIIKLDCAAMKGLELLQDKKWSERMPVIVIADFDQAHELGPTALRSGATYYFPYTPTPEYLVAQLYSILSFQSKIEAATTAVSSSKTELSTLTCGPIRLDQQAYQVFVNEKPVKLQPLQFKLLAFLMLNARQRFTRPYLLEVVWNNICLEEQSVTRCISDIRAKLPEMRNLIRCRAGGYVFEDKV